jgi:integrase
MARGTEKLSARGAATKKPGRYGDGGGLYLVVSPSGARKWVFRFTLIGKVTEMGLGSADAVSLSAAREAARDARKLVARGENPIAAKRQAAALAAGVPTFAVVADAMIDARQGEWRNLKHREQWRSSLKNFTQAIREKPVDQIDTEAVLSVLTPLWATKPETASRLRQRIEAVLDAAKAKGHRAGENPARWRGHLKHLLPKRSRLSRGHHAAMAYHEVPAFVQKLRKEPGTPARALEVCILTATRSGEIYGARWSEIDLKARIWTIPAARMKGEREHRIPLPGRVVEILQELHGAGAGKIVFPNPRGDRPLSHVVMAKVLRRLGEGTATVHGFRSAFRDWAGNETPFAREVAEAALAHVIGDEAEQAYRRGDALTKRRALMQAWADFIESRPADNIVPLTRPA